MGLQINENTYLCADFYITIGQLRRIARTPKGVIEDAQRKVVNPQNPDYNTRRTAKKPPVKGGRKAT